MSKVRKKQTAKSAERWYVTLFTSVRIKSLFFMLFFGSMIGLFGMVVRKEFTNDKIPDVHLIDMVMRKKIRDFSSIVKSGIYIKNFEAFDMNQDNFIIDMVVWFEFFSDQIMPDMVEKFSFLNGKILRKSPGDVRIDENNKMFVKYNVRLQVKGQLNYHHFPFDDHIVPLVMVNDYVTPSEMYFTIANDGFVIAPQAFSYDTGWRVKRTQTAWGYQEVILDEIDEEKRVKRPALVASVHFVQSGYRFLVGIFVPIALSLFFAFFTFLLGLTDGASRVRFSLGGTTALLSYRFVIERMIPKVGYFTMTDYLFTLFLVTAFLILVFQAGLARVLGELGDQKNDPVITKKYEIINGVTYYLFTSGFLGLLAFFLLRV